MICYRGYHVVAALNGYTVRKDGTVFETLATIREAKDYIDKREDKEDK